jgi:putative heme-binding domain-containing protein
MSSFASRLQIKQRKSRVRGFRWGLMLVTAGLQTPWERVAAQTPEWIWAADQSATEVWFRKPFQTPPYTWNARLTVAADDEAQVFLNGKPVATCTDWREPVRAEVSVKLNQGPNVLAVHARNRQGRAGLLVHLNMGGDGTRQIVSDSGWVCSTHRGPDNWNALGFHSSEWQPAATIGPHGTEPWGDILFRAYATPADAITVLPGFVVERIRSAAPDEGSWVNLCLDEQGRIYVSPEGDRRPLLRFSLNAAGEIERVEPVPAPIRFAMGLLFAHGSLYANARGPSGAGLYRLTDRNANDQFDPDELHLLKPFEGGGEHGYHALALGPDGSIYVLNGNGTEPAKGVSPDSPYRHYSEDILSLNPDETSRARGELAPGCYILRMDPDGREWELFAGGMRNAYDFDFSPEGELFTYDSDNEWDWGMPWYRATRVYHCVSGAEMGWRDGTRAWPDHYPEQVRGVVDVGIGSPCGVQFGTHSNFPGRYRRALFLQDWSYGRIIAVHLEPHGASYRGTVEEFLRGQPLNLTDLRFGKDGAMYFITGGRGTQSGLYRVTYRGGEAGRDGGHVAAAENEARAARETRRRLEAFHRSPDPDAVNVAWPYLRSPDRALRFAARVAVEAQPVSQWKGRALAETDHSTALAALLALARVGQKEDQAQLFEALRRIPFEGLSREQRLEKLRVYELGFIRGGRPDSQAVSKAIEELSPLYPAETWNENRELSRLLITLEAPEVVSRTLELLESAPSQEQQIHYVAQLSNLRTGWTAAERERYFSWWLRPRDHLQRPDALLHWFHDVGREYVDGASANRHLESFRRDAIAALPESERTRLEPILSQPVAGAQLIPAQPRQFVHEWTMAELVPYLEAAATGRDFDKGRRAFIDTQCYACHRLGNAGGGVGPELTAVGSKYSRRELLESLVEPSKVISEQYQNVRVFLKDGEEVTGRLIRDAGGELVVETDPLALDQEIIPRGHVDEIRPSAVSAMPEGLINVLTRDDILDLLAFLESGGNADAPAFARPDSQSPRNVTRQSGAR